MKIVNKKLSLKEFGKYVNDKDFGSLPPTFIVLHHTYVPTVKTWNGQTTINGLKKYYEGKGWTAAPHLFIAEDGIWLFTDMYDVGIHAGAGNGTLKTGYSIGIEVVGNYDNKVWEGETYKNTVGAIKILQEKLGIPDKEIAFHRDFSSKSCPGWAITKDWVLNQINNTMSEYKVDSKLRKAIEEITETSYDDKLGNEEVQEEAAKDLNKAWESIVKDKVELIDENAKLNRENIRVIRDKEALITAQDKLNKAHDEELKILQDIVISQSNKLKLQKPLTWGEIIKIVVNKIKQ